jgi:hypothetical protein
MYGIEQNFGQYCGISIWSSVKQKVDQTRILCKTKDAWLLQDIF